jgi:MFS family permease
VIPSPRPPSLWHNRDYLSWWAGETVNLLGTYISAVAFPLLVLFTTGSVLGAGTIAAAGRIGLLATMLWGGVLADRYSRRVILVVGPLLQALVMGVITGFIRAGHTPIALLAFGGLISGLVSGVVNGAELPALRRIVPKEQFAERAAQQQGIQMGAQLASSPLSALLFTVARWIPFGIDALSFAVAALGSALIRRPLGPARGPATRGPGVLADLRDGVRLVRRNAFLRYTAAWLAMANMVGNSFSLLMIALLRYRGADPRTIGVIIALVMAGGIVGSLVAGRVIRTFSAYRIFVVGNWATLVLLAAAAVLPHPWQTGAVTSLDAAVSVPMAAVSQAYIARLIPDRFAGRVGSVMNFSGQSLTWVGMLLVGALADAFGAPTTTLVFAGLMLPFAVSSLSARSLDLYRVPLGSVRELDSDLLDDHVEDADIAAQPAEQ